MTEPADLPPDHIRLSVTPALPPPDILFGAFAGVDALFRPEREWRVPETWRASSALAGERVFFLKRFERAMQPSRVVAWAAENGYRPATHLEAIAFALERPDLVLKAAADGLGWVMALGSSISDRGHPHAAILQAVGDRIRLEADECRNRSFPLAEDGLYLLVKLETR